MPKLTIEEAGQLGLLSPEELAAIGYNPFTPKAGASWAPQLGLRPGLNSRSFFRYPSLYQRPGISSLRFGIGGLGQGLTLSPESPALGLGGIPGPVGNAAAGRRSASYGVAGGVAGGRAGFGAEGSGNLRSMILPDGRRLVRLPDGRTMIVGGQGQRPIQADSPEGVAALQAMGLAGRGISAVKDVAALIDRLGGETPAPGVPGVPEVMVVEEPTTQTVAEEPAPGGSLIQPASLLEGAMLSPESIGSLTPEQEAALGELGINTEAAGYTDLSPDSAFWRSLELTPSAQSPGAVGGSMNNLQGQAPAGPLFAPPGAEMMPGAGSGIGDLALSQAFYAPGGGDAASVLLDPETRRLYDLGLTPEDIMAMMPAPIAGRADTAPRGLGPRPEDIFGAEPEPAPGGGIDTNFTLGNSLGLVQSGLGLAQGAVAGDPAAITGGLLKSGQALNKAVDIPGVDSGLVGSGLTSGLGILNAIQAARRGDVPGTIGGSLQTAGGGVGILGQTGAIAPGLASGLGAGLGGVGGLLSIAMGVRGLLNGSAKPLDAAMQIGGGSLATYSSLSTMFPSILPSVSSLVSGAATSLGLGAGSAVGGGVAGTGGLVGAEVGAAMAGTGGAAAAGGGAAAGAGAGAAAGTTVGASTVGLVMLPFAAMLIASQVSDMIAKQNKVDRLIFDSKQFGANVKSELTDLQRVAGAVSLMDDGSVEGAQKWLAEYNQFQQNQKTLEDQGLSLKTLREKSAGRQGSEMLTNLQPFFVSNALGRVRAADILAKNGMDPGITPEEVAVLMGSREFNSSEGHGRGGWGHRFNQWLEKNYPMQYSPGEPAIYIGGEGETTIPATPPRPIGRQWTPEGLAAVRSMLTPGNFEKGAFQLFGGDIHEMFGGALALDTNAGVKDKARLEAKWLPFYESLGIGLGRKLNPLEAQYIASQRQAEQSSPEFQAKLAQANKENQAWWAAARAEEERALHHKMSADQGAFWAISAPQTPVQYPTALPLGHTQVATPFYNQFMQNPGAVPAAPGGPTSFDPLAFLSSLERGDRVRISGSGDQGTLEFVPYKPEQREQFAAPDAGYQQIGDGFYAKASGQGAEIYLPQDRASELGKALGGFTGAPSTATQVGELLAQQPVASGQEQGATPGTGPAGDIAPSPVAAGTAATTAQGTAPNPTDATAGTGTPVPGTGFKKGGVVPETGRYLVHKGEVVIPADKADTEQESEAFLEDMRKRGDLRLDPDRTPLEMPKPGPSWRSPDPTMPDEAAAGGIRLAHHEESETVQDEDTGKWINVYGQNIKGKAGQRLPGSGEYDTVEEAEEAARARSEAEGKGSAKPPKVKGWYVHLKEGIPSQDLDGTDPEVRRLAFTPEDVEQALEAGEAPIMVGKGVLSLPPSAFRGFLKKTQDMQNKDPMKHPAVVAMMARSKREAQLKPEGDTMPGGTSPGEIQRRQPRWPGDRPEKAIPLDSMPKTPDYGSPDGRTYRNMEVEPPEMPFMPSIPTAPKPGGMQVRGLGGPGIGRAMRLAQGPAADFARQDKMLEGIDTGRIAPSTLGGASRQQRQDLTPQDIQNRPARPAPTPGLLEQARRRILG